MRLAVVVWEYPPHVVGGLGVYAGAMVPTLRAAGHLVDVFAAVRRDEPPAAPGVHWVRPLDLSPVYAGVFERAAANWGSFFGELFAANVLWAERVRAQDALAPYDLLVIHDWLSAPAGLILRATLRRPMVFHVHSTERGRQATAPSQLVDTWEETLGHQADAVITVSDAMREDLLARAWPADQLHAVWNGVDARIYHPGSAGGAAVRARYHIPATAPVVLFIGRLTAVKGVLALAHAWPAVVRAIPAARLILLGSGELEGAVRDGLTAAGVWDSVTMRTEFVAEGERIAHYLACDVAVFPSTYEPFGIVGLEAMACGRPAVVGARGLVGLREQIVAAGPAQTGLHVNGNDAGDIAWGLTEALRDRARLQAWGTNARRRVEELFTWEHTAVKTLAVYQTVTGAAAATGRC